MIFIAMLSIFNHFINGDREVGDEWWLQDEK